ncbi:MAG: tetratricopeptide repeat protein [Thermodesulfovibrionales bacterium]
MKTGRNEPCPCGSGKKYKKCCEGSDRLKEAATLQEIPSVESLLQKAVDCHNAGRLSDAEALYRFILEKVPRNADALHLLGMLAYLKGNNAKAELLIRDAISADSNVAVFHFNLGKVLKKMNRQNEAIVCYRKALFFQPDMAEAHYNLANEFCARGEYDEAVQSYRNAIKIRPDHSYACNNLSLALRSMGQTQEALHYGEEALRIDPDNVEAYNNLGVLLSNSGQLEKSIDNFNKAVSIRPDYTEAHWNMALPLLQLGDFVNGWKKYALRDLQRTASAVKDFSYRRWDGSSLKDKTLFIYAEQGVGDEIMFASVLTDVIPLAKYCIVECNERLVPLFSRSFPELTVIPSVKETLPEILHDIDAAIPIGSLPMHLRPDLGGFPQRKSYLVADADKIDNWRNRFRDLGDGLTVGISWRGGNEASVRHLRSTKLYQWADLLRVSGIQFINLQYGDCKQEIEEAREHVGVIIYDWEDADPLKDLDNFAAQISALDLVISVDNSTLHMAGALGVPAWALLPKGNNWRWLQGVEDTPWYSSLRLFSQKEPHDWSDVFLRVRDLLSLAVLDRTTIDRLTQTVAVSYRERLTKTHDQADEKSSFTETDNIHVNQTITANIDDMLVSKRGRER